jgi:hypothetical protein
MPATSAKPAKEKRPAEDFSLIRLSPRLPYKSRFAVKEIDRAVQKAVAARKALAAQESAP